MPQAMTGEETVTPREIPVAKKVLFIGDSMTGWLAERLNAYGKENGFEVATIVWDGSTISKWANSPRLSTVIEEQAPDAVFISLGMNELFEPRPEQKLKGSLDKIKEAVGEIPMVWIGPPSWPGHKEGTKLNDWLETQVGSDNFFRSFDLDLQRQSSRNPHPTREGIKKWMDHVVTWVDEGNVIKFPGVQLPKGEQMSRGKVFIYKRMKERL